MHLRSIAMKGFKSFPSRTKLEFGPGVSVIVGPNGSGKSNITDGVLWALGEQSPLAVRGQTMKDVIFAGGHGVGGSSSAEVEVVIDNSDGALPTDFSEISIVRRLDRDGEGEYRLNGARCRLVDVLEVLSDSGLGKEMHSVVSQGKVEAIVLSRPRERRLMIEEAAGLGKHRKRRRRAQLKLERTEENLSRALDVEREARSRLRPLKRQAEAAELHERIERQSLEARMTLAADAPARAPRRAGRGGGRAPARRGAERDEAERLLAEVKAPPRGGRGGVRRAQPGARAAAGEPLRRGLRRRAHPDAPRARPRPGHGRRRAARAPGAAAGLARGRGSRSRRRAGAARRRRASAAAGEGDDAARASGTGCPPRSGSARSSASCPASTPTPRSAAAASSPGSSRELAAARARAARAAGARWTTGAPRSTPPSARPTRHAPARREAERAVEAARSRAADAGAELAALNRLVRGAGAAPGGEPALVEGLKAEAGFEPALAAALGARLTAAVVEDLAAGEQLLDGAGDGGATALVARGPTAGPPARRPWRAPPGCSRTCRAEGRSRSWPSACSATSGSSTRSARCRAPSAAWPSPRAGRLLDAATGELSQAPAGGDERLLRGASAGATGWWPPPSRRCAEEAGARAEVESARPRPWRAPTRHARRRRPRSGARRASTPRRPTTAERAEWLLERRRESAGRGAGRASAAPSLSADLRAERRMAERAERERAERARTLDRCGRGSRPTPR